MISAEEFAVLARLATKDFPLDCAYQELTERALELTQSNAAMVAFLDEEDGSMAISFSSGQCDRISEMANELKIKISEGEGIIATVAASLRSIRVGDVAKNPDYRKLITSTKSEMAVPIMDRTNRLRGVLNLESDQKDHYSEDDQLLAEGVASLLAVVKMRDDRLRREIALIEIGSVLDQSGTKPELISKVLEVTDEVLLMHSCTIFLYDSSRDLFVLSGTTGSLQDKVGEIGYRAGEGCTGWVCRNSEPILIDEPVRDARWSGKILEIPAEQIASFLCVPIVMRGTTVGAMRVIRRKSENPYIDNRFTQDDLRLVQAVADQLGTGLENLHYMNSILQNERLAAWGELSAKSSHMIGNRVFALKGDVNELMHLASEENPNGPELIELAKSFQTNIRRIEEILQDFRDYLSASQVSMVPMDLNGFVRETVLEVFPRRSDVQLQWQLADSLPEVSIDPIRLKRAITELVENSLSIISEGHLSVTTRLANQEDLQRTRRSPKHKYITILIEDEGPGVLEANKEKIFEPFFSTRVKGMGLGLSIVRGIVSAHGGTVVEVGSPGKGAAFLLLLPALERR